MINYEKLNDFFEEVITELKGSVKVSLKPIQEKICSLEAYVKEEIQKFNGLFDKADSLDRKINSLEKKLYNTNQLVLEYDEKLKELEVKINTVKINKKDLLKVLQEEGYVNLHYNLMLKPRIQPENPKEGLLLIDSKDKKLKYFTGSKWEVL